jgi:hypothetical protein
VKTTPHPLGSRSLQLLQTEAWQITVGILQSQVDAEHKMFAATTLRGKVTAKLNKVYFEADEQDHLRHPANTRRSVAGASRSDFRAFESFCSGPATYSNPTVRLLGHPSNTNDGLERCCTIGRIRIG